LQGKGVCGMVWLNNMHRDLESRIESLAVDSKDRSATFPLIVWNNAEKLGRQAMKVCYGIRGKDGDKLKWALGSIGL